MLSATTQATLVRILLSESAAVQAYLTDPEASLTLHTASADVHVQIASVPTPDKRLLTDRQWDK